VTRVLSIMLALCVVAGAAATAVGAQGSDVQGIRSEQARGAEAIMDLLEQKDRGLTRREATLEAREADLRAAEAEVQARLDDLEKVRDEISQMLTQLDDRQQERVTTLVKMMEAMRDKQAAAILDETEDVVALEVLMRMNTSKAGKALAKMAAARAAFFAEQLGAPALPREAP
jgi:flagellar motility protein MotE (MotC chaperone)